MKMPQKQQKALLKSEEGRLKKLTELEATFRVKGFKCIAGVDEAGRGPLAGPVVAAACSIPEGLFFSGINDSKLLLPKQRKELLKQLLMHEGVAYGIGVIGHFEIDQLNIHHAALAAMRLAVEHLPIQPDCLLVDGKFGFTDKIFTERIVKGDSLSQMIAAASIIAKETRDQMMIYFDKRYPEYGFAEHKGYATAHHREALEKYGPCPIHRRSFSHNGRLMATQLTLFD